jgi:hypothetical protein
MVEEIKTYRVRKMVQNKIPKTIKILEHVNYATYFLKMQLVYVLEDIQEENQDWLKVTYRLKRINKAKNDFLHQNFDA